MPNVSAGGKAMRCESCRERDRRHQFLHRVRRGEVPMRRCFRCQTIHPYGDQGERYCFLSAEDGLAVAQGGPPP